MERGVVGLLAAAKRLGAPRSLKATSVGPAGVTLKWSAPKGAKPKRYLVLRDGRSLGRVSRTSYTDSRVKPGRTYRYTVRALDAKNRRGALSSSVRVKVPKVPVTPAPPPPPAPPTLAPPAAMPSGPPPAATPTATPTPPPARTPTPVPTATPTPDPANTMTAAMVDRMFWRAGFGPSPAQRAQWTGKRQIDLVDWFLNTPLTFESTDTPPKSGSGVTPIDPRVSDEELVLEWLDRMQRAINPLPDRLALFWHRHWAVSRDDGSVSLAFAISYRDRLLKYSDFQRTPNISFRTLAYEITTGDAAMSAYLNLNANTRTRPNENYARELMELFCLGPTAPDGSPNYTQADIVGLTQALTGWRLNSTQTLPDGVTPNPDYGKITFAPNQFHMPAKTFLGQTIAAVSGSTNPAQNPASLEWGPAAVDQAIGIVLAHPQHARFLITKLWGEFIAGPIPEATLDALAAAYTAGGAYNLRPVIRGILGHPAIFESIEEPNLVKPPVVYAAGVLRQLRVPLRGNRLRQALIGMQQQPYRPPNVAGWEGGMSWLNTNTVQARFDMVVQGQYMKYSNYYRNTETPVPPASVNYPPDVNPETAEAVFERAYDSVNRPWISDTTRAALIAWAGTPGAVPTNNAAGRRQRFYALQAMILGGPDGQVM